MWKTENTKTLALLAMCLVSQLLPVNAIPAPAYGQYGAKPATMPPDQVFLPTAIDPALKQDWFEGLFGTSAGSMYPHAGIYLYLRGLHAFGFAAYEALAPFTPGLKGFLQASAKNYNAPKKSNMPSLALSDVLRVKPEARTLPNKKVAVIYAVYKTMVTLWPETATVPFNAYMAQANLPVDMDTMDPSPKGIGNQVATALIDWFLNDGTNQLGNLPDITYNRIPYSDYTGYAPVQGCEKNVNIGRWQPNLEYSIATGLTCQSTLPTWAKAPLIAGKPYTSYKIPKPSEILDGPKNPGFRKNVERIINFSAMLNDTMKCVAETVDSRVVETARQSIINKYELNMDQQIMFAFATLAAVHDGDHAASYFKIKYDNARPYSVIRNRAGGLLQGNITAWAGPYLGTRSIKPTEWRQFVKVTHGGPDAPSGAVTDNAAQAVLYKMLLQTPTDTNPSFDWTLICPKGWSQTEAGYAPTQDVYIKVDKMEDLITFAKNGREWSGIHFQVAADSGEILGRQLGLDLYTRLTTDFGWSCAAIGLSGTGSGLRCT